MAGQPRVRASAKSALPLPVKNIGNHGLSILLPAEVGLRHTALEFLPRLASLSQQVGFP